MLGERVEQELLAEVYGGNPVRVKEFARRGYFSSPSPSSQAYTDQPDEPLIFQLAHNEKQHFMESVSE